MINKPSDGPIPDEVMQERYKEFLEQQKKQEAQDKLVQEAEDRAETEPRQPMIHKAWIDYNATVAWEKFKMNKIGVSEADGSGTPQSMAGFGLNEEIVPGDDKVMPKHIQNDTNMKRKIVGNEGYSDVDNSHTDSFYLPGKIKDEEENAEEKTEGKKLLTENNQVHRKEQKNTGITGTNVIGGYSN